MANHYYDATGVLMLGRVTPVISALFGGFSMDESFPGDGHVYIARMSESNDPQWSDVLENLTDLAVKLDLPTPDDPSMGLILSALAKHFGADQDTDLQHLTTLTRPPLASRMRR